MKNQPKSHDFPGHRKLLCPSSSSTRIRNFVAYLFRGRGPLLGLLSVLALVCRSQQMVLRPHARGKDALICLQWCLSCGRRRRQVGKDGDGQGQERASNLARNRDLTARIAAATLRRSRQITPTPTDTGPQRHRCGAAASHTYATCGGASLGAPAFPTGIPRPHLSFLGRSPH